MKEVNCKLVSKRIVGEKDGNKYDFVVLYVKVGNVLKQIDFDFKKHKDDYLKREYLLNYVDLNGEEV